MDQNNCKSRTTVTGGVGEMWRGSRKVKMKGGRRRREEVERGGGSRRCGRREEEKGKRRGGRWRGRRIGVESRRNWR